MSVDAALLPRTHSMITNLGIFLPFEKLDNNQLISYVYPIFLMEKVKGVDGFFTAFPLAWGKRMNKVGITN